MDNEQEIAQEPMFTLDEFIEQYKVAEETPSSAGQQLISWLSELKIKRDCVSMTRDDILILGDKISQSFRFVFDGQGCQMDIVDDGEVLIYTSFCVIEVGTEDGIPFVQVSFDDEADVILSASVTMMLRDLFKGNLIIGTETYVVDKADGSWYWGTEEIRSNHERMHGKKISPFIYYGSVDEDESYMPHC